MDSEDSLFFDRVRFGVVDGNRSFTSSLKAFAFAFIVTSDFEVSRVT